MPSRLVLIRGSRDQPPRFVFLETQHHVGGKPVGGILFRPQNRNVEEIEQRVSGFVQEDVNKGTDHRIDRADAGGRRGLGRVLPESVNKLVTNRDGLAVVPGVGGAFATPGLENQRPRQPKRAEQIAYLFQCLAFHQRLEHGLVFRRFRLTISDLDPVGLEHRLMRRRASVPSGKQRYTDQGSRNPRHARLPIAADRNQVGPSPIYAAADLPSAALTRGITCSAISSIERLEIAGSAQSMPA
jgi:hypothetical protein